MTTGHSAAPPPQQQPAARAVVLAPGDLHRPNTAWPTVILAACSLALWLATACAGMTWSLPLSVTFPVSTLAIYMSFTPMHEAAHSLVSPGRRWLNEVVGWLSCWPFILVPHALFRVLHLTHHKHTNDPDLDPDHMRPARGVLVLFSIWAIVPNWVRHLKRQSANVSSRAWLQSALFVITNAMLFVTGIYRGFGHCLLQFWVLPTLAAASILGFFFSYTPHHPHNTTRRESLYGCTSTVDGFFSATSGESTWVLTWLMLGQNFHSIHHMYPVVPFYAYASLWRKHKDAFLSAGVPLVALLSESGDDGPAKRE